MAKRKPKSREPSTSPGSPYRQGIRQADEILAKDGVEIRPDNWQQLALEWFASREPDQSALAQYIATHQSRLGVAWARAIIQMQIFLEVQDYYMVIEHYERALRSYPRCALVDMWAAGYILRHEGDLWRVRQMCLNAAADLPTFAKPFYELGFMSYLVGDFAGALNQFDRAAALVAPDDLEQGARIFYNRGLVRYALGGDKQASIIDVEEALRRKPDYPPAKEALRAFKGKLRWFPW